MGGGELAINSSNEEVDERSLAEASYSIRCSAIGGDTTAPSPCIKVEQGKAYTEAQVVEDSLKDSSQRRHTLASEHHPVRRTLRPCRNSKHAEKPCSRDRESCEDPEGALMARGGRRESSSLGHDLVDDTRRVPKGPGPLAY